MNYPFWEVELAGDQDVMADLSRSLNSDALTVTLSDGRHVLRLAAFAGCREPNEVRALAQQTVEQLRGMAAVLGLPPDLDVGSVYRREGQGRGEASAYLEPATGRSHASAVISVTLPDGTRETRYPTDSIPEWLICSVGNDALRKAVRLFGKGVDLDWGQLFRILEVAEDAVDESLLGGWISNKKRKLLRQTANSALAAGDDARHGTSRGHAPPPRPMPIGEARTLIRHVLREWLEAVRRGTEVNP